MTSICTDAATTITIIVLLLFLLLAIIEQTTLVMFFPSHTTVLVNQKLVLRFHFRLFISQGIYWSGGEGGVVGDNGRYSLASYLTSVPGHWLAKLF